MEVIAAITALEDVVAGPAEQHGARSGCHQRVVAVSARDVVELAGSFEVPAAVCEEQVVTLAAVDEVVGRSAVNRVVSVSTSNEVDAAGAAQDVVDVVGVDLVENGDPMMFSTDEIESVPCPVTVLATRSTMTAQGALRYDAQSEP